MIKTCEHCGAEFTIDEPRRHKRFCSGACEYRHRKEKQRCFEREWTAWKRDFALGKTQSNIKEAAP